MKYAIIAGTGFDYLNDLEKLNINTDYGDANISVGNYMGLEIAIINRHTKDKLSPSKINYRANIMALKNLGVNYIYGICAVGSLKKEHTIGSVVLPDDFLDMTKCRISSFYLDKSVKHLEVTKVYSDKMKEIFYNNAKDDMDLKLGGIYVCTEGPRFETRAEIKLYQMLGCDIVGMTNVPECILANELGINYCNISYITNYCTGMATIDTSLFSKGDNLKQKIFQNAINSFIDIKKQGNFSNNSSLL